MRRSSLLLPIRVALYGSLVLANGFVLAQSDTGSTDPSTTTDETLSTVTVTGSRIPRAQVEGPAPITVISAAEIKAGGFGSIPDVLRSVTQNGGETQSQQSSSGADFSPGAQQVDLRGLGPNHTLVLVNGRRIADSRCHSRVAATSPMYRAFRSA